MKKLSLKPQYAMLPSEITFLNELPKNATDTEIKGTDKRMIENIYYKYFGSNGPLSDMLMANEMKKKWEGNERKKTHEAQRSILFILQVLNATCPSSATLPFPYDNQADLSWLMGVLSTNDLNTIAIIVESLNEYSEPLPDKHPKTYVYRLNGIEKAHCGHWMHYKELVCMAYPKLPVTIMTSHATIGYKRPSRNMVQEWLDSDYIDIEDMIEFTVDVQAYDDEEQDNDIIQGQDIEDATKNIIINGRETLFAYPRMSYKNLCKLAKVGNGATCAYQDGPSDSPEGSLVEGGYVDVVNGMIFHATTTSNA